MPKIDVSETVNRPTDEVYAYLADPRNELQWQSSARDREVEGGGPIAEGSRIKATEQFLGRKLEFIYEVVEHDPDRILAMRTVSGPFDAELRYTIQSADEGTLIELHAEGAEGLGGAFGKLAEPVVTRIFKRETQHDLGKLKEILESES